MAHARKPLPKAAPAARFPKAAAFALSAALAGLLALALSGCIGVWPPSLRPQKDDSYTLGGAELTDVPSRMEVDWTSGRVTVQYHDGPMLAFYERCPDGSLEELPQMAWKVDGDRLYIEFVQPGQRYWGPEKELTILVPSGHVFEWVYIHASSADIDIPLFEAERLRLFSSSGSITGTLTADELTVTTTSGDMTVTQTGPASKITLESTSGSVFLDQRGRAGEIEAKTVSGAVEIDVTQASSVKAASTSGAVTVLVPADWGFTGRISTTSGTFRHNMDLSQKGKDWTYGDGSHRLDASTTSGDIDLQVKM